MKSTSTGSPALKETFWVSTWMMPRRSISREFVGHRLAFGQFRRFERVLAARHAGVDSIDSQFGIRRQRDGHGARGTLGEIDRGAIVGANGDLLLRRLGFALRGVFDPQHVAEIAARREGRRAENGLGSLQLGRLTVGEELGVGWHANNDLGLIRGRLKGRCNHDRPAISIAIPAVSVSIAAATVATFAAAAKAREELAQAAAEAATAAITVTAFGADTTAAVSVAGASSVTTRAAGIIRFATPRLYAQKSGVPGAALIAASITILYTIPPFGVLCSKI